jgi:hydrogenase nickel insertion protein HypA
MHEVSVASSLLEEVINVANENGAKRVNSIRIKIGKPFCINLDSLNFAFRCLSQDTIAEGARIDHMEGDEPGVVIEAIDVD